MTSGPSIAHRHGLAAAPVIRALLADGLAVRFRAAGDSMYPALCGGDILIVEPVNAEQVRRGTVVLAQLERGLTAHRVVGMTTDGGGQRWFTTRGDGVEECDAPFGPSSLLGIVTAADRNGILIPISRTALIGRLRLSWQGLVRCVKRVARSEARETHRNR
ncbi:MAG: Peptidase S24-like protein [Acidobacteria bacterium]|nr:Peptidase S24-like protein [Acidobacteriota bacterium]